MAHSTTSNFSGPFLAENSASTLSCARGSHSAHFYSNESVLVAEVGPRLAAALSAGGAAVVIAEEPNRRALAHYLESCGIDLNLIAGQGRWLSLDAVKALGEFMVGDVPDPDRFASLMGGVLDRLSTAVVRHGSGPAPIAAYGEMVAVLWQKGNRSASLRLEELWNDLARSRTFHLSCGWPLSFFSSGSDAAAVDSICSEHTDVTPAPGYNTPEDEERGRAGFLWQLKAHKVLQSVSRISRQTLGFYRDASSPVRVSISDAVDEVLAINEYRLRLQDISVRKNIRSGLSIRWPQGECKQILSNLVANAIDASMDGAEIYIAARASRHPVTGVSGIRLTVGDQGIGIPSSLHARVFTPFFVGRKDINIGLGLWTVKDLLDKRGGFIRFRSRVAAPADARPSGTLMTAFLPAESSATSVAA